jgi:hypothetical protein
MELSATKRGPLRGVQRGDLARRAGRRFAVPAKISSVETFFPYIAVIEG